LVLPNEVAWAAHRGVLQAFWDRSERRRPRGGRRLGGTTEVSRRWLRAVALVSRPDHLDPATNHGIPELVTSLAVTLLTEDSVVHFGSIERPLRIVDQLVDHNRLDRTMSFVTGQKDSAQSPPIRSRRSWRRRITSTRLSRSMRGRILELSAFASLPGLLPWRAPPASFIAASELDRVPGAALQEADVAAALPSRPRGRQALWAQSGLPPGADPTAPTWTSSLLDNHSGAANMTKTALSD
jgi:hypothetical protein